MYISTSLAVLAGFQLCSSVNAHAAGRLQILGTNIVADFVPRGEDLHENLGRSPLTEVLSTSAATTGALCGSQNGGISCPAGQCCSSDGHCGTGEAYCRSPECQFQYGPACDFYAVPSGKSTSGVPRPALGSISYTSAGIVKCTVPGTVALTYDDGPYLYTNELLDELKAANAKATFFITGNNFYKQGIDNPNTPYPAIIRRMYNEGHQIASHTWTHEDLDKITPSQRMDQMIKNEMAFRNILGFFPTYMRPPYDSCTTGTGCRSDITNLGYHIVEYTIDTHDWENQTPDLIQYSKNNVTAAMQGHSPTTDSFIAYAHDTYPQTVTNLTSFMLTYIKSQGYRIVSVGECLNDPQANWYRDATTGQSSNGIIAANKVVSSSSSASSSPSSTASSTSGSTSVGSSVSSSAVSVTPTVLATSSPSATPTGAASRIYHDSLALSTLGAVLFAYTWFL